MVKWKLCNLYNSDIVHMFFMIIVDFKTLMLRTTKGKFIFNI